MTAYLIFRWVEDGTLTYERVGKQQASSPKQALRKHHAEHASEPPASAYAVVPDRNWTELTPDLVTETRLVFR